MDVDEVRDLLVRVLDQEASDGRATLQAQAAAIVSVSGSATMVDIDVGGEAARADVEDGPLSSIPLVVDESGVRIGELLVWISEGRLSALEIAWWTDSPPLVLPAVSQLRFDD